MVPMPRRILVTGAAGRIGRAVVDLLASYDVTVTALVLEEPPGAVPADRLVVGDAADPSVAKEYVTRTP